MHRKGAKPSEIWYNTGTSWRWIEGIMTNEETGSGVGSQKVRSAGSKDITTIMDAIESDSTKLNQMLNSPDPKIRAMAMEAQAQLDAQEDAADDHAQEQEQEQGVLEEIIRDATEEKEQETGQSEGMIIQGALAGFEAAVDSLDDGPSPPFDTAPPATSAPSTAVNKVAEKESDIQNEVNGHGIREEDPEQVAAPTAISAEKAAEQGEDPGVPG
jgi:hypothetical protein